MSNQARAAEKPTDTDAAKDAAGGAQDTVLIAVRKLTERAKANGSVTYDDINEFLPEDQVSSDQIEDVMVPTENVVEVKRGVRVEGERKFFPGYILVKLELSDEAWQLVTSQPRVTGFLGGKGKPVPITNSEAERLIRQVSEGVERPRTTVTFDIGEQVRVSDGPFASFNGFVEEADDDKARLKVTVSIFGRSTPVELEYSQVEKI